MDGSLCVRYTECMTSHGELLNIPVSVDGCKASTLAELLKELLATVWWETTHFNAMQPFGHSNWKWQVYVALVNAGAVAGFYNDAGELVGVDEFEADHLVCELISTAFTQPPF